MKACLAVRAANRARQIQLYGTPLGDPVWRLTQLLQISQARLARVLGISAPMLSQLVSAQRASITDPTALERLHILCVCCRGRNEPLRGHERETLLATVSQMHWSLRPQLRT